MKRKALSPVIATVLLIAMVIVIGLIVFLFFKNLAGETITKFDGENIKLVCDDVAFSASYSSEILTISNIGNVPIYGFDLKLYTGKDYSTERLADISGVVWSGSGLNPGGVFSGNIGVHDKIQVIPVLLGISESGEKVYVCDDAVGKELA